MGAQSTALSSTFKSAARRRFTRAISQGLKVHADNEFHISLYLGEDLLGAIEATPMEPEDVTDYVLNTLGRGKAIKFDNARQESRFSLAGVHMK